MRSSPVRSGFSSIRGGRFEETTMNRSTVGIILTLSLGLLVASLVTAGQPPTKVARVGFLMPSLSAERARNLEAFRQTLRDLGWVEGQNLTIELRHGEFEQLPDLAAELVQLKVDVMVTMGGSVRAAKDATSTIPIVMGGPLIRLRKGTSPAWRGRAAISRGLAA